MKILYIIPALIEAGGVEKILYDWIIRFDKHKITVDILAGKIFSESQKHKFEKAGCTVYEFGDSMWSIHRRIPKLKRILANGYDILHVHSSSPVDAYMLAVGKQFGIKIRIIHSHNAVKTRKITTCFAFAISKPFLRKFATHFFGCSEKAIYVLCGRTKKIENNHKVIKNGIQIERYLYNKETRAEIRKKYNLEGKFVVGNVGRICSQKNQLFLLDVFSEVLKRDKNSILLLVGDGNQRVLVEEKARKFGIAGSVVFTGNVPDASNFYQAMDCFAMTSLYEGLSIAGIEAQTSGLQCFLSSSITKEVQITKNVEFISLHNLPTFWAERILVASSSPREDMSEQIKGAGYDIEMVARELQNLYLEMS